MIFYADKFKEKRKQGRWSLGKLAKHCGVDPSTASKWESGIHPPSELCVRKLASVLGISVSEISDLPDDSGNAFTEGIKEFKSLSKVEENKFKKEEEYFISCIRKQRETLEKTTLVINSLLNSMNSAFYVKDVTNKYVIANNEFLKFVNLPEYLKVEGNEDKNLLPRYESDYNSKTDQNVLELKAEIRNQQMHIPGTRKKRWGLVTKLPIRSKNGQVQGMLCTIKDITEEKKSNELNQELRAAISNIQDVVWTGVTIEYKFKYTSVNESTQKLLGVSQEEFLRDEWKQHIHPDFFEKVETFLKNTKTDSGQIEYQYIHPVTEKTHWLQSRINIDKQYHFGIIRDITESYQNELEKEYLFKCLNDMDSMFWVAKSNEKVRNKFDYLTVSKGIEKVFGRTKAELENDSTMWEKRSNPDNIHSHGTTSYEVDYVFREDSKQIDKWIHEVIYRKDNMLFGLASDISKSSFLDKGNRKLLDKAIDEISHGVVLLPIDKSRCFYANSSAAKIFGINKKDFAKPKIVCKIFNNFINKQEKKDNSSKGSYYLTEYYISKEDSKWLEVLEQPFSYYETKCVLVTIKEITKERNLENLQDLILQSIGTFNIGFSIKEAKSMKILFDASASKIFGFPKNLPLNETREYWLNHIVHPDDRLQEKMYFQNRNLPKHRKYRIIHPEKGLRWIEARHSFITNNGVKYMISFMADITEQYQQELEREYLFKCLNDMDSMYWVAKSNEKVRNKFDYLTVSKGVEKVFDRTKAELENDSTIWEKRSNPDNIHSHEKTSYEVDYVFREDSKQIDKWIHEVIYRKDNMLFGLASDISKSSFLDKGNRKLLDKAIDEISHGVVLLPTDKSRCFYANSSASKIFEIDRKDFANPKIVCKIFNNFINKQEKKDNSSKGSYYLTEYYISKEDSKWLEVLEQPFSYYETKCVLVTIKEITKERKLENLQDLILQSIGTFNVGFSIKEAKSMKILFDNSAKEIFGIPANISLDEKRDYWLNHIVHPDTRLQEKMHFQNRDWPEYRKYRIIHPEKGLRWIEARHSFITNNEVKYMISFMTDITERENAEAKR